MTTASSSVSDLTNAHLRDLTSVDLSPDLTASATSCLPFSCKTPADFGHLSALFCPELQSLDLTANRLQTFEPALLALTGTALGTEQCNFPGSVRHAHFDHVAADR